MIDVSNRIIPYVLYLALNVVFLFYMSGHLNNDPIDSDAAQNLEIGYNLYKHQTFGLYLNANNKPIPSNVREPLPPIMNALFMYLHPDITQQTSFEELQDGVLTKTMKQVNLIWIFILLLGVGYFIYLLSDCIWLIYFAWLMVVYYFIHFGGNYNVLYTELAAAALIIWCSVFVLKSLRTEVIFNYLILGILTGLLILIKVSFLYLALPLFVLLTWFKIDKIHVRHYSLYLVAGIFIITGPWVLRNYIQINEAKIVNRGGKAAYTRMLFNQMSVEEISGAVYAWGPKLYKDLVAGTDFEAKPEDFEIGGRFEAVTRYPTIDSLAIDAGAPDETIRYFSRSLAMEKKLILEFSQNGLKKTEAEIEAHKIMTSQGLNWMLKHPIRHSMMSAVFFWRGMWCFPNSTIPFISSPIQKYIHNVINGISYILLFVVFIYGLFKKHDKSIAISLFPVLMLLFYGGLTHNLPRYSEPAIPSMLVSLTIIISFLFNIIRKKYLVKDQ